MITPGPRGARGRIWRVADGSSAYALKELPGPPPPPAAIRAELALARGAAAAGVRSPAARPARQGRYVVPVPGGWLRLFDWVELSPASPGPARPLGELLARLHRCAPAA